MSSDDASSSATETDQGAPYSPKQQTKSQHSPPSHDEESQEEPHKTSHHGQTHHRGHLSHQHRVPSITRLSRHHAKPAGSRTASIGKNLNKRATQNHHDQTAAQAAATHQPVRPSFRRAASSSLTSTSTSPRPSQTVRRNASAYAIPRAGASSALKKNHSSGHLSRHGTNKGAGKAGGGRAGAPPMKRTQSSKSQTQKSPIEPPTPTRQHHGVRFDIGDGAPGDEDDDNEWTEDSNSISPVTTRDHTRQNSVILDPHNALRIGQSSITTPSQSSPLVTSTQAQDSKSGDTQSRSEVNIKRTSSSHNIPTADAITSRLLMRAPAQNPAVTNVAATATHAATPPSNLSNDSYTIIDQNSSGSGVGSVGSRIVGRFINGGSSQGTPLEIRAARILDAHKSNTTQGSPKSGHGEEKVILSKSLDSHRKNKSLSNVANARLNSRTHQAASPNLPPSRTQQKLELQRASSVLESTKHVIPVLPKPSAPALLRSGVNIGFGFTDTDHYHAQIQSLFSSIGKEYTVVRRYRRPLADSLYRIDAHTASAKRKGKGKSLDPARSESATLHRSRHRRQDDEDSIHSPHVPNFHHSKPTRTTSLHPDIDHHDSSPEKQAKRKNRVSFEIAPQTFVNAGDADGDDEDDEEEDHHGRHHHHKPESEVVELCRRMWELDSIANGSLG